MTDDPGAAFRALHRRGAPFILANAWDAGAARVLAALGARAIATSSAAHAFTLGRTDGQVTLDAALAHAATLAAAVDIPLAIDFENGFGATPDKVAEAVTAAAATGAAGVSIEDWDGAAAYDRAEAIDRLTAAAEAARAVGLHLTARADGVMHGVYDMPEALARLAAFAEAGADCLYAPLVPDFGALAEVVALGLPVNALAAGPWLDHDLAAYAEAGVARVSLGSSLARALQRDLLDRAGPLLSGGRITALKHEATSAEIDAMMGPQ